MSNLEHCHTELQEIAKYNVKSYKATRAEHHDNARLLWNINSNFYQNDAYLKNKAERKCKFLWCQWQKEDEL